MHIASPGEVGLSYNYNSSFKEDCLDGKDLPLKCESCKYEDINNCLKGVIISEKIFEEIHDKDYCKLFEGK